MTVEVANAGSDVAAAAAVAVFQNGGVANGDLKSNPNNNNKKSKETEQRRRRRKLKKKKSSSSSNQQEKDDGYESDGGGDVPNGDAASLQDELEEDTCHSLNFIGFSRKDENASLEYLGAGAGVSVGVIDTYTMGCPPPTLFRGLTSEPAKQETFHRCKEETYLSSHGVVCSSMIAGKPQDVNFFNICEGGVIRGVAPGCIINTYAIGCKYCTVSSKLICDAIRAAVEDNVHLISMSMGIADLTRRPKTLKDDVVGEETFKAFEAGILTCVSAGNKGPAYGTLNWGMPWCLNVGACSNGFIVTTDVEIGVKVGENLGDTSSLRQEGDFYIIGKIKGASVNLFANDEKNAFWPLKFDSDARKKARGLFLVWDRVRQSGTWLLSYDKMGKAVHDAMLSISLQPQVAIFREGSISLSNWKLKFSELYGRITRSNFEEDPRPTHVLNFSSRGPAFPYDEIVMPNVIAPGASIASYWPGLIDVIQGAIWEIPQVEQWLSTGTSFSTALVAGAMAYLMQKRPLLNPWQLISSVMTTAKSLGKDTPHNEFGFGSGILDIESALTPGLIYDETQENINLYRRGELDVDVLNLPSFAACFCCSPVSSKRVFSRILTSDEDGEVTYTAKLTIDKNTLDPTYYHLNVDPTSITFSEKGDCKTFYFSVSVCPLPQGVISGFLKWSSNKVAEREVKTRFIFYEESLVG